MFWILLLAHFLADFPLQPNWMVKAKRSLWVLALHVGTHLVVMLLLVGPVALLVWPYLLFLAAIHFLIDVGKNEIWRRRPDWVVWPYLIDQLLHYISIGIVAAWIQRRVVPLSLPFSKTLVVVVTGYLLATYVWFITERILYYADASYLQEIKTQFWSRMISRAALLTGALWVSGLLVSPVASSATVLSFPYLTGKNAMRALVGDILVALSMTIFIRLVI